MNTGIKRTLIALSIAAAFALPATAAFAGGHGDHDGNRGDHGHSSNSDSTSINTKKEFFVGGHVWVDGYVPVTGDAEAVIHDAQGAGLNSTSNTGSTNSAGVGGSAAQNAQGNVGVNVAAGSSNVQANEAALAASDASDVFGMAQVYNSQVAGGNTTTNVGATNNASLGGSVMQGASGNLNVNVAAGDNNLQKNALSASGATNSSAAAIASIDNSQFTFGNNVDNNRLKTTTTKSMVGDFGITLTGNFAGKVDQYGNQYPDIWGPDGASDPNGTPHAGVHPSTPFLGHMDLDSGIQGGQDRPVGDSLNPDGSINQDDLSNGGGLSFNQAGQIALSGTASGAMPVKITSWKNTTNTSSLGGSAFMNASGNIGVNVASGSNNLQSNILSISSSQGGSGSVPGGGGVGGG